MVLDVLAASGSYEVHGITDVRERLGRPVTEGHKIDLLDSDLPRLYPDVGAAFVSHGEDLHLRRRLFGMAKEIGYDLPVLTSPGAYVSHHVRLGEGTLVMHKATVNASAIVGANAIVNTGAIVEHHCAVGDHTHIAPGAVLCGGVRIGELTLVGANSVIIPGVCVGSNVVVGAGSVVTKDVPNDVLVAGSPAIIVGERDYA